MSGKLVMHGPFVIDVKVHFTDGKTDAVVTYSLAPGKYPDADAVKRAVVEATKAVKGQSKKFKPMDRPRFQNTMLSEQTGQYIEFAAPRDWDELATTP